MVQPYASFPAALKEFVMRFTPAALALSLVVMVSASMGQGATREADPRARVLIEQGQAALAAGQVEAATDAFEAALAIDPGHNAIFLDLAQAARAQDMQGKAIRYYRIALEREPQNYAAISGEGQALVEKGAVEKARRNLARLESLCGASCPETRALADIIASGVKKTPVITAEAVAPSAVVTQN
jgi:tetratricopeptide (TPR) repeat protein